MPAAMLTGALALFAGCAADGSDDITADALERDATTEPIRSGVDGSTVLVAASAGSCTTNRATVHAGEVEVLIANDGDTGVAVEVRSDGGAVLAERDRIEPGTSADIDVDLDGGDYRIACIPFGEDALVVALRVIGGASPSPAPTDG